jgi:hypothetical protein
MSQNQISLMVYIAFWATRVSPFFRRWRLPLVRGTEWFFSVHVPPDFYGGPGKKLLRNYRLRVLLPFILDIAVAVPIFISGHVSYLIWLVLALTILIHALQMFSVDLAERQARQFAVAGTEQPAAALVVSLQPRRLRDYTNWKLELGLGIAFLISVVGLAWQYFHGPVRSPRMLFGPPLMWLYAQAGVLFVKRGLVAWRTPVPQIDADQHLQFREAARKLYLQVCDWYRVSWMAAVMLWPIFIRNSPENQKLFINILVIGTLVGSIPMAIWLERRRNALLKISVGATPMRMPDFLDHDKRSIGPVCYQPATPMLLIRHAHGYSLNLANRRTQMAAVYLAGLVALITILRAGH